MVKAVFLDFYGTVVHEDGEIVKKASQEILHTGKAADESEVDSYWWNAFQAACSCAYGDAFETQRALEYQSLRMTIQHFHSSADAESLSGLMFEHWIKPSAFPEANQFFEICPVPIYIVSNIDRADILQAIAFHGLKPTDVFTSEDAKSYKPRKELFEYALKHTGLSAKEVVHIGDSLSSDVKGASSVGIKAIWVNRTHREVPEGIHAIGNLLEVIGSLGKHASMHKRPLPIVRRRRCKRLHPGRICNAVLPNSLENQRELQRITKQLPDPL